MEQTFFGGDPTKAHFTTDVPGPLTGKNYKERRRAEWAALKAIGFKNRYFQFRVGDEAGKAKAEEACLAFAAEWSAKVGFALKVCEGAFL